jgi:hypothetical protein
MTEVKNPKEIQGEEIINFSRLVTAVMWQQNVLRMIANKHITRVLVQHFIVTALIGAFF